MPGTLHRLGLGRLSGSAAFKFGRRDDRSRIERDGLTALAHSSALAPAVNPFISLIRSSSMQYDASPCSFDIGYLGCRAVLGSQICLNIASKLVKCRLDRCRASAARTNPTLPEDHTVVAPSNVETASGRRDSPDVFSRAAGRQAELHRLSSSAQTKHIERGTACAPALRDSCFPATASSDVRGPLKPDLPHVGTEQARRSGPAEGGQRRDTATVNKATELGTGCLESRDLQSQGARRMASRRKEGRGRRETDMGRTGSELVLGVAVSACRTLEIAD